MYASEPVERVFRIQSVQRKRCYTKLREPNIALPINFQKSYSSSNFTADLFPFSSRKGLSLVVTRVQSGNLTRNLGLSHLTCNTKTGIQHRSDRLPVPVNQEHLQGRIELKGLVIHLINSVMEISPATIRRATSLPCIAPRRPPIYRSSSTVE
jgi:hypothetical protein